MKLRQAPFWLDRFPARRAPSFPKLRGSLETRVVVIGGGLTGAAAAWSLAAARVPVVLLEAESICHGATAGAIGLIREEPDSSFATAASAHGLRAARSMWQAVRRASLDFPAALRRLGIKSDLTPQDLLTLADRGESIKAFRREYEARRGAGLEHRWLTAATLRREAAVDAPAAIRTTAFGFDPYRAGVGLVAAAVKRGATVFERSPALRVRNGRHSVTITTAGGEIDAESVIVAGAAGIPDLRPLRRHLHARDGYGVVTAPLPAVVRRELGARKTTLRASSGQDQPPRFIRWLNEDRVLIAGADQPPVPAQARDRTVVQRTGQLMYELSLLYPAISGTPAEWGWSLRFEETVDGLPYIGTHRNFPRHFFALGMGRHGAAVSWLAARILARQVVGEPAKGDDLFGFSRILR